MIVRDRRVLKSHFYEKKIASEFTKDYFFYAEKNNGITLCDTILYGCERVAVAPLLSLLLPSQFLRSDTRNAFQYEVQHNAICFESFLAETMVRFVPSHRRC